MYIHTYIVYLFRRLNRRRCYIERNTKKGLCKKNYEGLFYTKHEDWSMSKRIRSMIYFEKSVKHGLIRMKLKKDLCNTIYITYKFCDMYDFMMDRIQIQ